MEKQELEVGVLYFINEKGISPVFDSYDIVELLAVMEDEPLSLVKLVHAANLGPKADMVEKTVLVPNYMLSKYEKPETLPEPIPEEDEEDSPIMTLPLEIPNELGEEEENV